MKTTTITLEQLVDYEPIPNPYDPDSPFDGCLFETYGEELAFVMDFVGKNQIWTLIDTDDNPVLMFGMKYVNRLGYLVTSKPYPKNVTLILENRS